MIQLNLPRQACTIFRIHIIYKLLHEDLIKMTIGQRMKYCRKQWGFSQNQIADYLGYRQGQIAKLENGSRKLKYADAQKLIQLFNVNPDWFIDGVGEPDIKPLRNGYLFGNKLARVNKIIKNIEFLDELTKDLK